MKEFSVNMEDVQNQENEVADNVADKNETETETEKTESLPLEPLKKHPLEHKWTLWFYENNKKNAWLDNLHDVYTFDTVEDFWCLYNHIRPIHTFGTGNDYALFKEGIQPIWEDPKNNRGGKWLVTLEVRQKIMLSESWLQLLLFMIGESFDECSDEICGAYINVRGKHDKINLWTSDSTKTKEITYIGKKLKYDCLCLPDQRFIYESHADGQRKPGSREKTSLLTV